MNGRRSWGGVLTGLLWSALLFAGCIRDRLDDCPPLQVNLVVKDKNYANVDYVEQMTGLAERVDESLPFADYISKLYIALYRLGETKPFWVQPLYRTGGDGPTHALPLPAQLPFGDYILMVWANMDTTEGLDADGESHTYRMHGGAQEGYDVYMSYDTLRYDAHRSTYTFELERIKGQLLIEAVEMPRGIHLLEKTVDNVYSKLDFQWAYSGNEQVLTQRAWRPSLFSLVTRTILAPTVRGHESVVHLQLQGPEGSTAHLPQPQPVPIVLQRNEITVLRYVYDSWRRTFDVYVLLKDGWKQVHDMGVEED